MDARALIAAALLDFQLDGVICDEVMACDPEGILKYISDKCRIFEKWIDWEEFCNYLDKFILNYIVIYHMGASDAQKSAAHAGTRE